MCDSPLVNLDELENGPILRFADWPKDNVPREPGVYTIWKGDSLIYVGMAGRGVQVAEIDEDGHPIPQRTKGLYGRLSTHSSGKRSGDQFAVYVCDHFVVPNLTPDLLRQLRDWDGAKDLLDDLTRNFVREHLVYRCVPTRSGDEARDLEDKVKGGALAVGSPLLNPAKTRKP